MKFFTAIVIVSIVWGCAATQKLNVAEVCGVYQYSNGFCSSRVKLKDDLTFQYTWDDLMSGKGDGKWRIVGKSIVLNSAIQPPHNFSNFSHPIRLERGEGDSLRIKVVDEAGEPLPTAICIIAGADSQTVTGGTTGLNGTLTLPALDTCMLTIRFLGFNLVAFKLEPNIRYAEFRMMPEASYIRYFTNEVWRFRKNRLYSPQILPDGNTRKRYYEKVN
ncbi:MAG: hypothetical protein AB8F95_03670 [Bacteroidia bacterium]